MTGALQIQPKKLFRRALLAASATLVRTSCRLLSHGSRRRRGRVMLTLPPTDVAITDEARSRFLRSRHSFDIVTAHLVEALR